MKDIVKRASDFIQHMKTRDSMSDSEAMVQGLKEALGTPTTKSAMDNHIADVSRSDLGDLRAYLDSLAGVELARRSVPDLLTQDVMSAALFSSSLGALTTPGTTTRGLGYTATYWIDDLIEESKPTIKHLGRPKVKS